MGPPTQDLAANTQKVRNKYPRNGAVNDLFVFLHREKTTRRLLVSSRSGWFQYWRGTISWTVLGGMRGE
jgi:hypothetical protein